MSEYSGEVKAVRDLADEIMRTLRADEVFEKRDANLFLPALIHLVARTVATYAANMDELAEGEKLCHSLLRETVPEYYKLIGKSKRS